MNKAKERKRTRVNLIAVHRGRLIFNEVEKED
jgi:hypothetical protein